MDVLTYLQGRIPKRVNKILSMIMSVACGIHDVDAFWNALRRDWHPDQLRAAISFLTFTGAIRFLDGDNTVNIGFGKVGLLWSETYTCPLFNGTLAKKNCFPGGSCHEKQPEIWEACRATLLSSFSDLLKAMYCRDPSKYRAKRNVYHRMYAVITACVKGSIVYCPKCKISGWKATIMGRTQVRCDQCGYIFFIEGGW